MDDLRVLSREDVLLAADRDGEWVDVPKWGGRFYVAEFGGHERDIWDQSLFTLSNGTLRANRDIRALVASLSVVKGPDDLTPVFTSDDVLALSRKSQTPLSQIYEVATRLSGLDRGAIEQLTDALKNALRASSGAG